MIEPNREATAEVLRRLKEGSEERFRAELISSIRMLLDDFQMTWDDLAEKLQWRLSFIFGPGRNATGEEVKEKIGSHRLQARQLNDIAHVFSTEPYLIFRPRKPYTQT